MRKKVSIIVPAYNCEKTLEKCIRSLLEQTYFNFEVVIINDGSEDNTDTIIERLKMEDDRIIYIKQENRGVSATRNSGLESATGDYVIFVDADDYVCKEMLEEEVSLIEKKDVDVVFFEYYNVNLLGKTEKSDKILDYKLYEGVQKYEVVEQLYFSSVWRAIYRKSLIDKYNLRFKGIKYAEDLVFNLEYIFNANNVFVDGHAYYYYCEQENSALKNLSKDVKNTIEFFNVFSKVIYNNEEYNLDELYIKSTENACLRILNGTITYRKFKQAIKTVKLKIRNKSLYKNHLIKYMLENKHFTIYLLMWRKKISIKISNYK